MNFESSFKPRLIYVFRINDAAHGGCLKVGETSLKDSLDITMLQPNSKPLNQAAKERINQYTQTAGIQYELLHTELTICIRGGQLISFNDGEVHSILERSGIKHRYFNAEKKANEWFETDLVTVKNALRAAKEGRKSLLATEISTEQNPIVLRPEQRDAVDKARKRFKKYNKFLWNAKMRFGKTLSALQLIKECQFDKTLILTHRPVVDSGWFEDFKKIFYDTDQWQYGSKNNGESFANLERQNNSDKRHYIYFASMQDLRGSEAVGGKFDKNNELFSADWSLIIIDEAHEGTKTELGNSVIEELTKPATKVLRLSGTPFNLLDDFNEDEIYTWDYVMEQRAKQEWDETHWGDPNPYAGLPRLNIYTYDLSLELKAFQDEEHAFNFREFFRTREDGTFIHDADVDNFLNLLVTNSKTSQYPYSTMEWRRNFRHSLWTMPGTKAAAALKEKLENHPVFGNGNFKIVNVAGDGVSDDDFESDNALEMVEEAIGPNPDETYTITLSCGRLTTGVSVKAWTAVFMMSGSVNTSASSYMQTIFRVQTPATINGRMKEECYVFDFAPDRTLKVLAETAKISAKAGRTNDSDRQIMGEFLNFCPVISFHGSQMSSVDVPHMMRQLKRVYVDRVVRNGFEDGYLYNDNLFKLDNSELGEFAELKKIIGQTKAMPKSDELDLNKQGFTNEEYEQLEKAKKKKNKAELTEEEKRLLEEQKERKKNRDTAISILRGISIRMPMILYGADIADEEEITIDNFTQLVDPLSWEEFMPKGVSKQKFNAFKKYYDPDIFAEAGKRIRELARAADQMDIEERIARITTIFSSFRNPDKETVLTPWRVVNMHLGDILGGYVFMDEGMKQPLESPRFIDHGNVTREVFAPDSRVLEINSKSGLYPLYVAYSIYRRKLTKLYPDGTPSLLGRDGVGLHLKVWDEVLRDNLFIVCKTPMAKSITRRTLAGFRKAKVNTRYFEDLINAITNKKEQFIKRITDGQGYWKVNNIRDMKFNAVVGNPPYQVMDGGTDRGAVPVYQNFVEIAKSIKPLYISMIIPSRWYAGGRGLDAFRQNMLNDTRIEHLYDYELSKSIFPTVDIAGGLCYFLWNTKYNGLCTVHNPESPLLQEYKRNLNEFHVFVRSNAAIPILKKVVSTSANFLNEKVLSINPFGFRTYFRGKKQCSNEDIRILTSEGWGYVSQSEVLKGKELINKYKIIIGRFVPSNGEMSVKPGDGYRVITAPQIIKPFEINTETYIDTAALDTKEEAYNYYVGSVSKSVSEACFFEKTMQN